jgi:predicted dehydrogenase
MDKTKVGIVGCGNISGIYFKNCTSFGNLEVKACADLVIERAQAKAKDFGCKAVSVDELLADPEIKIVVNLTIPIAHASVSLAALAAGKSVHNEKPLAITREDGKSMLQLAKQRKLRVGGAPDTFMGGGLQTCRKLIDDGAIGTPLGAAAFMLCPGHESWHPAPEFYYKAGGGPMFDMGPYYLTALVSILGPVKRVCGATRITFPERTITSSPKAGTKIQVDVPTHVVGVMDFASGAIGSIVTSFDVCAADAPLLQVWGSEGGMLLPDPNGFGGPVKIRRKGEKEWRDVPLTHGNAENMRGIGVADMAAAIRSGRKHRANGEMAYHVLDVMHAFHDASDAAKYVKVKSTCERPLAMPTDLAPKTIDA